MVLAAEVSYNYYIASDMPLFGTFHFKIILLNYFRAKIKQYPIYMYVPCGILDFESNFMFEFSIYSWKVNLNFVFCTFNIQYLFGSYIYYTYIVCIFCLETDLLVFFNLATSSSA